MLSAFISSSAWHGASSGQKQLMWSYPARAAATSWGLIGRESLQKAARNRSSAFARGVVMVMGYGFAKRVGRPTYRVRGGCLYPAVRRRWMRVTI